MDQYYHQQKHKLYDCVKQECNAPEKDRRNGLKGYEFALRLFERKNQEEHDIKKESCVKQNILDMESTTSAIDSNYILERKINNTEVYHLLFEWSA